MSKYLHIAAWNAPSSSKDYIRKLQRRAKEEGAPIDAVYYSTERGWVQFDDVKNIAIRSRVLAEFAEAEVKVAKGFLNKAIKKAAEARMLCRDHQRRTP